jgi:hypothetical protein
LNDSLAWVSTIIYVQEGNPVDCHLRIRHFLPGNRVSVQQ